ncbi:MAG TPA: hypothetical protein DDZ37_05075 [Spirochaetaceae bacterium]|nr:hypothetical protein [Spirochaetaceae bacterium]
MNNYLLFAIAALGVATTIQYFFGLKKNRWLGKTISMQAENLLTPKNKEYVNIGGAIGHNFTYKLREPWKEAKGTFTLFPRHSLLYMPFSLLIGGSDRFFLNLYTDRKLVGEAHIIEKAHLKRAKIEDLNEMHSERQERGGKTFFLYWRYADLREMLLATLDAMPNPSSLSHFCCYRDNKTFFLYLKPSKGEIAGNLKAFMEQCPHYFRQEKPRESRL